VATKRNIDLDRILQVSIAIADQQGLDAVSLASVAAELGIKIPSLYNHVAGLSGLRYQMSLWAAHRFEDKMRRAAVGKAGDGAVYALAVTYREFAHEHPGAYRLVLRAARPDEPELMTVATEILNILVAVIAYYGFDGDNALHAIRALRSVLHGFVDLEAAGGFGLPLERDESFQRLIQMLIDGLHSQQKA
jgi:AcrR family transcriptional regulator